jgi:hypothetical protein
MRDNRKWGWKRFALSRHPTVRIEGEAVATTTITKRTLLSRVGAVYQERRPLLYHPILRVKL